MRRSEKWPELLSEFFAERRVQTFAYGTNDCGTFVCDGVLAMTGTDIGAALRGRYSAKMGATKVLKAFAGDLEAAAVKIAERFEMDEVPVLMARRGDVVLLNTEQGLALGLVGMNGHKAMTVSPDGTVEVDVQQWKRAWRVY